MCYEIESVQRVRHYHTLLVFNYYSQSVKALADAIGVPYISATRVKTDVRRTKKYMILQSTRVVVDVTLRREVNGFVDFLRRPGTHADISIETASLGHPGIYNPTLKRKVDWTPVAFTPMYTDETEMEHVHPIDLHVSRVVGEVGSDYKGETFVCIPVDEGDEVTDVPVTVGAWSTYYKDTTPF
jgi:hypothetical protein